MQPIVQCNYSTIVARREHEKYRRAAFAAVREVPVNLATLNYDYNSRYQNKPRDMCSATGLGAAPASAPGTAPTARQSAECDTTGLSPSPTEGEITAGRRDYRLEPERWPARSPLSRGTSGTGLFVCQNCRSKGGVHPANGVPWKQSINSRRRDFKVWRGHGPSGAGLLLHATHSFYSLRIRREATSGN